MKSICYLAVVAVLLQSTAAIADVKVGVGAPFTGPNATFGAQMRAGVEAAAEDINAKGGINGEQIKILLGDDRSDPKEGVSAANKMVGDGVRWVIGHYNSGVSIPASDVYSEGGVLELTPASTSPIYTDRGLWNTFRDCGRDDQQGRVAGNYLADNFKDKKIAIVHDRTPYGKGLADETQKTLNARGVKEVIYEGINPGEKDYSALISKLKSAGVQVLYYGGLHTEAGLIIRQMHDAALNAQFMTGDGILSSEFVGIAGPGAEGVLMTFTPDPRNKPEVADIVAKLKAKNISPEAYTLYSYAALQVLADAASAIKTNDPEKVAAELHLGKPYHTVIGDLSFDTKGDLKKADYVVYEWKKTPDGRIDYVGNQITK